MRHVFAAYVKKLISENNEYALLLGDISVGLFVQEDDTLPKNIFNIGILEQSMVSFSAGLSSGGITPFIHTISPFIIERAYEQIKLDLLYNKNKVVMVSANGPYDYNKLGPTHHCASDVPLMDLLNPINIFLPGRTEDVSECINKAIDSEYSSYIRLTSKGSSLQNIKANEVYTYQFSSNVLNVVIGESLYYLENKLSSIKEDWIYIYDTNCLQENIFKGYKQVIFWEPYSKPILALRYKSSIDSSCIIKSQVYPVSIEFGIYNQPEFIELEI